MRKLPLLIALVLVISACRGTSGDTGQTTSNSEAAAAATEETPAPLQESQESDGPAPIDFALDLADGTPFTLSGEQKPVYLVFWAEW